MFPLWYDSVGGDSVALSAAKRKSNDKYIADHYQRLFISYPKEYVDKVKAAASARGESVAGFVKSAIDKRLDDDGPDDAAEST